MDDIQLETPGSAIPNEGWAPTNLRLAAPAMAMTWFALRGIVSSLPIEPVPFDLIANTPTGLCRVQVKSTTFKDACGGYLARIGKRRPNGSKGERLLPYRTDEIDHFFIVDAEFNLYFIPVGEIGGKTSIILRAWDQYRCGNARGMYHPCSWS